MRIATFKHLTLNFTTVMEESKRYIWDNGDYIRVSAWADVEFAPITMAEVKEDLAGIDARIAELEVQLSERRAKKMEELAKRRAALTELLPAPSTADSLAKFVGVAQ